jgi:hypothetical protein
MKMVTEWAKLAFVIRNPFLPASVYDSGATGDDHIYIAIEPRLRGRFAPLQGEPS